MSKTISIIVAALVVAAGFVLWQRNHEKTGAMTNGEMLRDDSATPIVTETDVPYFEGAKGYAARPAADGDYPGVVLIHENRGLRPEIRDTADQLARAGYAVLAVDLLGKVVETQDEARSLTAGYDQQRGIGNMKAAVAYLKDRGATKVASLGWCFGGGQSLQLALSGERMDATVIYYGRLATTSEALSPIEWPVLGIFAGDDQSISAESVSQFGAALEKNGTEHETHVYPGVKHTFANPSGMSYAPEETKDAWARTLAFLGQHLR